MKKETFQALLTMAASIPPGASMIVINGKAYKSVTHHLSGFLNELVDGELVLSSNKDEIGVRSFSGNSLPAGVDFICTDISAQFDCTTGIQALGIKKASFGKTDAPVCYKNGKLSIRQGGEVFKTHASDTCNSQASTGMDANFREILLFKLRQQAEWGAKISLAGTPAVDQAYNILFRGWEEVAVSALN